MYEQKHAVVHCAFFKQPAPFPSFIATPVYLNNLPVNFRGRTFCSVNRISDRTWQVTGFSFCMFHHVSSEWRENIDTVLRNRRVLCAIGSNLVEALISSVGARRSLG